MAVGARSTASWLPPGITVLRGLRWVLHASFLLLLTIAAVQGVADDAPYRWVAAGGAALLAVVYATGGRAARRDARRWTQLLWLAVVTALWGGLLVASPHFSWVAFPLFFWHLHLLGGRHAVGAIAVITAAVVATQGLHSGGLDAAMVLGPALGAVSAVVISVGYSTLYRESQQRLRLIEELTRARDELSSSQHRAGVLAERERLAREIHDTLAQGLSSIVLLLRAAENELPAGRGRDHVRDARASAVTNLEEARRFVRDLTPPSLATQSLAEALRRLCQRVGRESGIDCQSRIDGPPTPLPAAVEVALLRSAQASLANVVAHARATTTVVTLGFLGNEVTLDIFDDGVGFDPAALDTYEGGTGFGLIALRDRITAFGGTVDVETSPGLGTAIAVRLPLSDEGEAT
ncbi:sensor histidine kinase [Spiractinospora alimapuensis]|uniref:sensor histidine kinase n=1 Tax=Spiractinospora alimapuensis TaxID=2820884 RepID=UPI001F1664AF|nr:sensor histidine kinase [Spiractinospora alimapuensis]QVQ52669.1 sensor histidine kinase [Spiractinospora alimapuensis]